MSNAIQIAFQHSQYLTFLFKIMLKESFFSFELTDLANVAFNKPTTQSSVSRWSEASESSKAVNGNKTGGFAFHTDLEENPWWTVDLEEVYPIDTIVIYNRDDEFSGRALNTSILSSLDGIEWVSIYSAVNRFGGILTGKPLIVNCNSNVAARYIRIQIIGKQYLHLDQVEIYVDKVFVEFKNIINGYVLSLNKSGLGDQLLTAKVSSFLLELVGLSCRGFNAESLINGGRISQSNFIYKSLGFTDLTYDSSSGERLVNISLDIADFGNEQVNIAKSLSIITNKLLQSLKSTSKDSKGFLLDLNITAQTCDKLICNSPYLFYHKTIFMQKLRESFKKQPTVICSSKSDKWLKIMFHIRLGDTAIIELPSNKGFVFPHQGIVTKTLSEMKQRFPDRWFDLESLRELAYQVKCLDRKTVIQVSTDGFELARKILVEKGLPILKELELRPVDIEEVIRDREINFMSDWNFVDSIAFGENDQSFLDTLYSSANADIIFSTGGHFIYNLVSLFSLENKPQTLYIRKYNRTRPPISDIKSTFYIEDFSKFTDLSHHFLRSIDGFKVAD